MIGSSGLCSEPGAALLAKAKVLMGSLPRTPTSPGLVIGGFDGPCLCLTPPPPLERKSTLSGSTEWRSLGVPGKDSTPTSWAGEVKGPLYLSDPPVPSSAKQGPSLWSH